MALELEFSHRSTAQLQRILTFYDKRNGSDTYSRNLFLLSAIKIQNLSIHPHKNQKKVR